MLSGKTVNTNCISFWFDPTRARTQDMPQSRSVGHYTTDKIIKIIGTTMYSTYYISHTLYNDLCASYLKIWLHPEI